MEVKVNRQRVVLADRAPSIHAVITEGALRQTVGPPRVSREQLDRLAALAETGFAQDLLTPPGPRRAALASLYEFCHLRRAPMLRQGAGR